MEDQGWVKIHRRLLNSRFGKDAEYLGLWTYLLLKANHDKEYYTSKGVKLGRGQFATGRKQIAEDTGLNENKVQRMLKKFEKYEQIEQQTFSKYRVITITNWDDYQSREQQVNNKRTASEHYTRTKEQKNKRNSTEIAEVIEYLNQKSGKKYKPTAKGNAKFISARLNDNYTVSDLKKVIDTKCSQWKGDPKMDAFLRPKTLFNSENFDTYLNEKHTLSEDDIHKRILELGGTIDQENANV